LGDEARREIGEGGMNFLSVLSSLLSECDWGDDQISEAISNACESAGIPRREGYASIYWALIGRSYGPKASSLLCEMDKESVLTLLRSA
jgi:lysyl-tRNA synthetase class I